MARSETFDYTQHNRKIASLRGEKWKKTLQQRKLDTSKHPNAIKVCRVRAGFSQEDMSSVIGVKNNTTYARIERAEMIAPRARAEKIAAALGVSVMQIFIEVEPDKFLAM